MRIDLLVFFTLVLAREVVDVVLVVVRLFESDLLQIECL